MNLKSRYTHRTKVTGHTKFSNRIVMKRKKRELGDDIRNQIIGAHKVGASVRCIGDTLGVARSTVQDTIKRFTNSGTSAVTLRSGRPKILSPRGRRALRRIVLRKRGITLMCLAKEISFQTHRHVSERTARRELHSMGLFSRYPRKVPLITCARAKERVVWCYDKMGWDFEWTRILWSDESRFKLFHSDGRLRVWRMPGEEFTRGCTAPTVKHGGCSVMFWGCIGWFGVGPLILVKGNLNSEGYVKILSENLLPVLERYNLVFQHDGAPIHRSEYTTNWLDENNVSVLPWVGQSPDLNPIEHLWDHVDRQIRAMDKLPQSKTELIHAIESIWNDIPVEVVRNLIQSMPNRVRAVIQSKGFSTRY